MPTKDQNEDLITNGKPNIHNLAPKDKDSKDKDYQKWLDNCTPFDEMPYFNKSTNTYDCYPTLDVGPCKPGEWFVLQKDNPKYAECVEQKCACGPIIEDYDYGIELRSFGILQKIYCMFPSRRTSLPLTSA